MSKKAILEHPMVGLQRDDDAPPYFAQEEQMAAAIDRFNENARAEIEKIERHKECKRNEKKNKVAKGRRHKRGRKNR